MSGIPCEHREWGNKQECGWRVHDRHHRILELLSLAKLFGELAALLHEDSKELAFVVGVSMLDEATRAEVDYSEIGDASVGTSL